MRNRAGKGYVIAFDAKLETQLEALKKERGFYPTLKEIGASFDPPHSAGFIFRSVRRLSDAGRLTDEAQKVYDSKNTKEHKNNEGKSVKIKTKKRSSKA